MSTGITGVTVRSFDIDRVSDTQVTVELTFDGTDFDTNSTITFTVAAGAIANYSGSAFTAQIPVTSGSESLVASTTAPLTEATLDESVVTLTLSGRAYEGSSYTVGRAITISGIDGVTFKSYDVDRISDTEVTVELTFSGDFDTNATLTFTVSADAIEGYRWLRIHRTDTGHLGFGVIGGFNRRSINRSDAGWKRRNPHTQWQGL